MGFKRCHSIVFVCAHHWCLHPACYSLLQSQSVCAGVCVIGATSRPDLLDAALLRPGRLDRLLYCGFPTAAERAAILKAASRRLDLAADMEFDSIAAATEGYTGALTKTWRLTLCGPLMSASAIAKLGLAGFHCSAFGGSDANNTIRTFKHRLRCLRCFVGSPLLAKVGQFYFKSVLLTFICT